jgi:hypothetical protein
MALHEPPPENCDAFVSVNGIKICDHKKVEAKLKEAKKKLY